ncbi:hypothetical protein FBY31_0874 [Arthrobacter sp. SLBN-100]|nr:hypothetical protein FBY31_0874 [Arthrobacter sp. SLBN-100]
MIRGLPLSGWPSLGQVQRLWVLSGKWMTSIRRATGRPLPWRGLKESCSSWSNVRRRARAARPQPRCDNRGWCTTGSYRAHSPHTSEEPGKRRPIGCPFPRRGGWCLVLCARLLRHPASKARTTTGSGPRNANMDPLPVQFRPNTSWVVIDASLQEVPNCGLPPGQSPEGSGKDEQIRAGTTAAMSCTSEGCFAPSSAAAYSATTTIWQPCQTMLATAVPTAVVSILLRWGTDNVSRVRRRCPSVCRTPVR